MFQFIRFWFCSHAFLKEGLGDPGKQIFGPKFQSNEEKHLMFVFRVFRIFQIFSQFPHVWAALPKK